MRISTYSLLLCIISSQRITVVIHGNSDNFRTRIPADEVQTAGFQTGERFEEQNVLGENTNSVAMQRETETENNTCKLMVTDESKEAFTEDILKHRFNFVYLKLNFMNLTLNETKGVILKNDWVWTYKGENGAYQYLYLPGDFGYLSFGLLWTQTRVKPFKVSINHTGDCSNLVLGEANLTTNYLIGNALADMTSDLASRDDLYNSSYWCYNQRLWLSSDYIYSLCKNAICTFQTFEYNCCKFSKTTKFNGRVRSIECGVDHYEFGQLWWMFPVIIGHLCFSFYPILLSSLGIRINRLTTLNTRKGKHASPPISLRPFVDLRLEPGLKDRSVYIPIKHSSPITFMSTMCSPLYRCYFGVPIISRLSRICIIIFPMVLSTIRVCLDYVYAKNLVIDAVRNEALVGFSSLIAGPALAREEFLYVFGGPVVALSVYVIFGCILIVFPSDLEKCLENGLPDNSGRYVFLFSIPIKVKERLSGIGIKNHMGCKRIHNILLAQIFMLLYWRFWYQAIRLFYIRWQNVSFPFLATKLTFVVACFLSIFILPVYIVFCFVELILSVIYFAFPAINCFWIVIKAVCLEYFKTFENRGVFLKMIRNLFLIPLLVLFCVTWYMFCIIFFDGFWFLSKIAMFTYSGVIAYPEVSYGYLILAFMSVYYLVESFNAFGETYGKLLKMSIECCKKFISHSDCEDTELELIMSRKGISRDLFMQIVDTCQPRRNQVMITLLKFSIVLTVLTVSVELLITFDKIQELSIISHVFTVLFICALPKIFRLMCMQGYQDRYRKRMKQKIYRVISHYMKSKRSCKDNLDEVELHVSSRDHYQSLDGEESDFE